MDQVGTQFDGQGRQPLSSRGHLGALRGGPVEGQAGRHQGEPRHAGRLPALRRARLRSGERQGGAHPVGGEAAGQVQGVAPDAADGVGGHQHVPAALVHGAVASAGSAAIRKGRRRRRLSASHCASPATPDFQSAAGFRPSSRRAFRVSATK